MSPPSPRPSPKRDAAASRQLILDAARRRFAQLPYGDVGLRLIGRDADVDPALVSRYFGNKGGLFQELLANPAGDAAGSWDTDLFDLVDAALTGRDENEQRLHRLLIIVRSIASQPVAELAHRVLLHDFLEPLAMSLTGEDRRQRAVLALSLVVGALAIEPALASEVSDKQCEELAASYKKVLEIILKDSAQVGADT